MKPIIFKIVRNYQENATSIDSKCEDIIKSITSVGVGNITNISEYDEDMLKMEFVSDGLLYTGNKMSWSPTPVIGRKTILELKDFNIFKYVGNSRIDNSPIFVINDDSCVSYRRDGKIKEILDEI